MGVKFSQLPAIEASGLAADDRIAVLDTSDSTLKSAAINHASSNSAFGVGTSTAYGHNKIIDNVHRASLTNGEALSAHAGKILADSISNNVETGNTCAKSTGYKVGEYLLWKDNFYYVKAAISVGNAFVVDTNLTKVSVAEVLSTLNSNLKDVEGTLTEKASIGAVKSSDYFWIGNNTAWIDFNSMQKKVYIHFPNGVVLNINANN